MEILRVNCLGKSLGIAKGLRIDILNEGESIGNTLIVDSFTEDKEGVVLFSEMLNRVFGKFRIKDLVLGIENDEIIVL